MTKLMTLPQQAKHVKCKTEGSDLFLSWLKFLINIKHGAHILNLPARYKSLGQNKVSEMKGGVDALTSS